MTRKALYVDLLLGLLYAVFAALRDPRVITHGRFWAEEGTLYFQDALSGRFYDGWIRPRVGYYSLFTKLAALLASSVELEWSAIVTVVCALIAQTGVAFLILRSGLFPSIPAKACALAVLLLAMPGAEVSLNSVNTQFFFAIGTAVLLASGETGGVPAWVRRAFLLMAGLTGPVSVMVFPLFLWRAWREKSRVLAIEAGILGGCALLQAVCVIVGLRTGSRTGHFDPLFALASAALNSLVLPWTDPVIAADFAASLRGGIIGRGVAILAVLSAGALFVSLTVRHRDGRWLIAAAAIYALLSWSAATGTSWQEFAPFTAGRYSFAPNVLIGLALVVVSWREPLVWRRTAALSLLAISLRNGVVDYLVRNYSGPDWQSEVREWRRDPEKTSVAIWPDPAWRLTLPVKK
jgi:hypothetical protein